jgi:hypothetical protein
MKFYDNGSFYDSYFAYGHEFGTSLVIRCEGECSAYGIAIDESPTIEPDEIPEAYGFYFMQAKSCFAPDNGEPWYVLVESYSDFRGESGMVSESVLKCTGNRRCLGEFVLSESGIWEFHPKSFPTKAEAIAYAMETIQRHELDLVEGYQHQSNSSGTGIVNVGHYEWLREADSEEIAAFKQAIPDESDESAA